MDKKWGPLQSETSGMVAVERVQIFMATVGIVSERYIQQQVLKEFYKDMTNDWKFRQDPLCLKREKIQLLLFGTYICTLTGCVKMEDRGCYKITVRMRNGDEEKWKFEYEEDGDTFVPLSIVYKKTYVEPPHVTNDVGIQEGTMSEMMYMQTLLRHYMSQ